MHPLDNATIVLCTEPPPGATLEGVQIRLLTPDPSGASDFPRGPFKMLRGDGMAAVCPPLGGAQAHGPQLGGEVDQLLRVENNPDLGTFEGNDDPGDTFFGRIGGLLNADAGRIDFGPAIETFLRAQPDQPQAGLDGGKRRHCDTEVFAIFRLPNTNGAVFSCDLGYSVIWQPSEHLSLSLIAPRWSAPAFKAAPERGAGQ